MRIFKNFDEAHDEVERELKHNGLVYQTQTVQDKTVDGNEDFKTKELIGYTFIVKNPEIENYIAKMDLNIQWIKKEFDERIGQQQVNPGEAWKERQPIWEEFIHMGRFAYTYSERIGNQVADVVDLLKRKPASRHGIITIYQADIDNFRREGDVRVPCTMYYMLFNREVEGVMKTHLLYNIRSNDFNTHFPYDIILARLLQEHIAQQLGTEPGDFIYQSGSLHAFYKDNKEIF